jgi:hypothetical protein
MREFNLELAKQGHPVCTRDGRKARILCYDALTKDGMPPYPIVALVLEGESNEGENAYRYSENGKYYGEENTPSDLMMASVKHEGWANVYSDTGYHLDKDIWEFEENAMEIGNEFPDYVATVKIEGED